MDYQPRTSYSALAEYTGGVPEQPRSECDTVARRTHPASTASRTHHIAYSTQPAAQRPSPTQNLISASIGVILREGVTRGTRTGALYPTFKRYKRPSFELKLRGNVGGRGSAPDLAGGAYKVSPSRLLSSGTHFHLTSAHRSTVADCSDLS